MFERNNMKTSIEFPHFTPGEKLNDFLNKKLYELEQANPIITGVVCLKLDKSEKSNNKICEIKIKIPGYNLYAKKQCVAFEEAIEQAVETLEYEISKLKK